MKFAFPAGGLVFTVSYALSMPMDIAKESGWSPAVGLAQLNAFLLVDATRPADSRAIKSAKDIARHFSLMGAVSNGVAVGEHTEYGVTSDMYAAGMPEGIGFPGGKNLTAIIKVGRCHTPV